MTVTIRRVEKTDYTVMRSSDGFWYPGPHVEFFDRLLSQDQQNRLYLGEEVTVLMIVEEQLQLV